MRRRSSRPKRKRLQAIASALTAIGSLAEPCVEAARNKLLAEKAELEASLQAAKPTRQQLRTALSKLQRSMTAVKEIHMQIQQLETVLHGRQEDFAKARQETLELQTQVACLSEKLRQEELATVASLSTTPKAAPSTPQPGPVTLLDWATGFAARAPPSVAALFEQFLLGQEAALAVPVPPDGAAAGAGDLHVGSEDDPIEDPFEDAALGAALAAAGGDLAAPPSPNQQRRHRATAMLGFGRVREPKVRTDP